MRQPKATCRDSRRPQQVGIFFLVGRRRLWFECTPLDKASNYGECKTHEGDHENYWDELVRLGAVPPHEEYQDCPRGRVNYNTATGRFTVYLDRCILRKSRMLTQIMAEMNLTEAQFATDPHYRCVRCLQKESVGSSEGPDL